MSPARPRRAGAGPIRTSLLACLALAAACAATPKELPTAPAGGDPDAPLVLGFVWPADLAARVSHTRDKQRQSAGGTAQESSTIRYRLITERREEGLLVRYDDFSFEAAEGAAELAAEARLIAELSAKMQPQYVIDREGAFVRIEGIEQLQTSLKELFDELLGDMPAQSRASVEQMMAPMLSEDYLTARASEEWNLLVGVWVGEAMVTGQTYTDNSRAAIPFLGGQELDMKVERRLARRLPCHAEDTERRCVELQMVSSPDSEQVKQMLDAMLSQLSKAQPGVPAQLAVREFEMENKISLITEPDRLLPHRLVKQRRTRVKMSAGAGPEIEATDVEEDTYDFSYDAVATGAAR